MQQYVKQIRLIDQFPAFKCNSFEIDMSFLCASTGVRTLPFHNMAYIPLEYINSHWERRWHIHHNLAFSWKIHVLLKNMNANNFLLYMEPKVVSKHKNLERLEMDNKGILLYSN